MAENRNLDEFIESLDTYEMSFKEAGGIDRGTTGRNTDSLYMDDCLKQKILKKTNRKLQRRKTFIKYAAAACILLAVLSSFIPNTPVYALRQTILSYIPGIGVVENIDETNIIKGVLAEPVKVTDGDKFVEIRSAFLRGNVLKISGVTNIGAIDAKDLDNVEDIKEFFSREKAGPLIYLIQDNERTKDRHQVWAGPSRETRRYRFDAYFNLNEDTPANSYLFEMDGLEKNIEIALSPVKASTTPEEIGNAAIIDDVMIFAHTIREKDLVVVLVSIVAPSEYKHPRSYLFHHEKEYFASGVYLTDQKGTRYEPDEDLRKSQDDEISSFYFHVPEDKEGLTLVVPQILFQRDYKENNIKITMPKKNKDTLIDKTIQLGSHNISLDQAALVPAGSEILPDGFKTADCLMLNASAATETSSRESVLRIVPHIQVMDSPFHFVQVSQAINAEFWDTKLHGGYSLISFDGMEETKKIMINFSAEFTMDGPWEIQLDEEHE
jgi:hypothetical protein